MITDSPEGIVNNDVMSEKVTDAQISWGYDICASNFLTHHYSQFIQD